MIYGTTEIAPWGKAHGEAVFSTSSRGEAAQKI
jgi:hypothetical protein